MTYRHLVLAIVSSLLSCEMAATPSLAAAKAASHVVSALIESCDTWAARTPQLGPQIACICFYPLRTYNLYTAFALIVAALYVFFAMIRHIFMSFREAAGWRKLRSKLRIAIENRDIDKSVSCCDQHRNVSVSSVISSIAAEAMSMPGVGAGKIDRLKLAGHSALRYETSKWTRCNRALSVICVVSAMLPIVATVGDLARDLTFIDAEGMTVWSLLSVFCVDSPFLVIGLAVAVGGYLLQQAILGKANRLELISRDLSVGFIVAIFATRKRANRKKANRISYEPQMWMDNGDSIDHRL